VRALLLASTAASAVCFAGPSGTVVGKVALTRDGAAVDASRVVVFVEDLPAPEAVEAAAPSATIQQSELQFEPDLAVVQRGTTVEFPNEDRVFHNVFSLSEPRKFDLGLYRKGTSKSVTFHRAGVVDVFCNIHPQMIAKIFVVDSAFFARPAADGSFRLTGLPPGKHQLVVWQPYGDSARATVTVRAGETTAVSLSLEQGDPKTTHSRKDGTPYGRYTR
jgi:plastocyanin